MGILEDVLKALERIPMWKRVSALPDEIEELRKRVVELENRLKPATSDACPKCREMTFTLESSTPMAGRLGSMGGMQDFYLCSSCNYTDIRTRTPTMR